MPLFACAAANGSKRSARTSRSGFAIRRTSCLRRRRARVGRSELTRARHPARGKYRSRASGARARARDDAASASNQHRFRGTRAASSFVTPSTNMCSARCDSTARSKRDAASRSQRRGQKYGTPGPQHDLEDGEQRKHRQGWSSEAPRSGRRRWPRIVDPPGIGLNPRNADDSDHDRRQHNFDRLARDAEENDERDSDQRGQRRRVEGRKRRARCSTPRSRQKGAA